MPIEHGALYLANLNPRSGTESGKLRPVLVIQNNFLNETGHASTWVLPCTSKITGESLLRVEVPRGLAGNAQDCEVMVDQSRAIDNNRIQKKLGMLPALVLKEVKEKLRLLGDI